MNVSADLQNPIVTPANNVFQRETGYRFVVDSSNEAHPFDWYNAYLESDLYMIADTKRQILRLQLMAVIQSSISSKWNSVVLTVLTRQLSIMPLMRKTLWSFQKTAVIKLENL